MSYWLLTLNLLLLFIFPFYVAGKSSKVNSTTTQRRLPKRLRGQLNNSLSFGKHSKGEMNIDIEEEISKVRHNKTRIEMRKAQDASDRPRDLFHSKRKSKVDIHKKLERPRHKKKVREKNYSKTGKHKGMTKKHPQVSKGKQKSHIDIHGVDGSSPVLYTSPDGQDHYLTLRPNHHTDDGTPLTLPANQQGIHVDPNLPSKTFLVTVYGDQIDGAEEKIRNALTEEPQKKCHPCKCSSTSCKQTEEACPCDETTDETNQAVSPQLGGQKLVLFPNAGRPFGRLGCICPCCLCSCSEPGYENYNCGCQNSPPVPCPCSSAITAGTQTSPVYPGTSAVASWTGGTSSCPCPCCPCACAQPQTYPNYQCGCASQTPTPCPCYDQAWNFYHGAENNVARSSENVSPTAPAYSPYTAPVPTNNGPAVQTFPSGNYEIESSCDCYCCPCSCPGTEYSAYENSQCSCGQETQAACTCRRSEVQKTK
jgi:hypothetical protein